MVFPTNDPAGGASDDSFELLRRHRAGDADAFGRLIEKYLPRITRIVRVRMGGRTVVGHSLEDVAQSVLLRVVQSQNSYERRSDAHWIDWVATLAQREILNLVRHGRAQKRDRPVVQIGERGPGSASADIAADESSIVSRVARREMEEFIDRALGELSDAHREVILLKDYADMDWTAIAESFAPRTVEACQELHRRARRELGKHLPPQ